MIRMVAAREHLVDKMKVHRCLPQVGRLTPATRAIIARLTMIEVMMWKRLSVRMPLSHPLLDIH